MKIKDHSNAKVERLGYKWFGCTVCGYNCYSKKWVKEHIENRIKIQMCEGGVEFGWFGYIEIKEKCEICWVKEACEAFRLKKDIALMHLHSKIFIKDPNIKPLMGLAEYARRYDKKVERLWALIKYGK